MTILSLSPYFISIAMMVLGLYGVFVSGHLIKKLFCLSIFQTSALLLYIALGKAEGGIAPILRCLPPETCQTTYSNPLPHVLMLTAIVVGVSTLAVGLALAVRIKQHFGSLEESALLQEESREEQV